MHRIDGDGHSSNTFVGGVPNVTPATQVTPDWLNAVQEELAGIVTASGTALNKASNAQVLAALQALFVRTSVAQTFTAKQTFSEPPGMVSGAGSTRSFYVGAQQMGMGSGAGWSLGVAPGGVYTGQR